MNLILPPKGVAEILGVCETTVCNRIRRKEIVNVFQLGEGHGVRYLVDMTKEYGISREDYEAWKGVEPIIAC